MKNEYVYATFIGTDSMTYVNGKSYLLRIIKPTAFEYVFKGWQIKIVNDELGDKAYESMCPYESLRCFLKNWRVDNHMGR
jgi:hypothetical protein